MAKARGIGADGKMLHSVAKANQKLDREMAQGKRCECCAVEFGKRAFSGRVAVPSKTVKGACEECAESLG